MGYLEAPKWMQVTAACKVSSAFLFLNALITKSLARTRRSIATKYLCFLGRWVEGEHSMVGICKQDQVISKVFGVATTTTVFKQFQQCVVIQCSPVCCVAFVGLHAAKTQRT